MKLADLQQDMRSWLTGASEGAARRLAGEDRAGLLVYQNNYRSQLVGCLQETYPLLRRLVGDEVFLYLAKSHIEHRPPHAWTLDAYGAEFGATLRALYPDNPDLHELAWIEWSLNTAFVARDVDALAPGTLAGIDWDRAELRFAPSLSAAPLSTNAEAIWSALHEDQAVPESRMLESPAGMIAWRRGLQARLRVLEPLEFEALAHARRHASFSALCALLVERLGEQDGVARAGALLADWIAHEIVVAIWTGAPEPQAIKPRKTAP